MRMEREGGREKNLEECAIHHSPMFPPQSHTVTSPPKLTQAIRESDVEKDWQDWRLEQQFSVWVR